MIKTVIFDMDGVIIDSEPVHKFAYHQHFRELNIEIAPEIYSGFTGKSTKNIYQILKDSFQLAEEITDLVLAKRRLFNEAFDKKEDLYLIDGVLSLIQDLHNNGMQLVLASSSSKVTIERIFKRFSLHKYFTHIVSGEDFPKSKPHPAIFEYAAKISKTLVENCIVIEDSTNGIAAAKAANIFCIGYDSFNSKLQDYSKANLVIKDFKEINYNSIKNLKP